MYSPLADPGFKKTIKPNDKLDKAMLAIAESGSTKTEWVLLNNENEVFKRIKTIGFNPDFHSQEVVFTPTTGQCARGLLLCFVLHQIGP